MIGRDLTLKLATIVKQRRIYIPAKRMNPDHPIAALIGTDAAEKLRRAFGGSLMPLGRCRSAIRSRAIASDWVRGWTAPQLATAHGCSQRTVERALGAVTTRDVKPMQLVENQALRKTTPLPPGLGSSEGGGMRVRRDTP